MTQSELILGQLKAGRTVTRLTALHLGVQQINEVIRRLRQAGHHIKTVRKTDAHGRRYAEFVYSDGEQVAA